MGERRVEGLPSPLTHTLLLKSDEVCLADRLSRSALLASLLSEARSASFVAEMVIKKKRELRWRSAYQGSDAEFTSRDELAYECHPG